MVDPATPGVVFLTEGRLLIKKLVVDEFGYETREMGWDYGFNTVWRPGNVMKNRGSVLRIFTDGGPTGEVAGSYVSAAAALRFSQVGTQCPNCGEFLVVHFDSEEEERRYVGTFPSEERERM